MKNSMKKSKKTLFKKTVFLLMLTSPFSAIGEIRYGEVNGNYRIYGHVENPTFKKESGWRTTGFFMYMSRNKILRNDTAEYCPDEKKAAEILNKMLSGLGTNVTSAFTDSTSTDYYFIFRCKKSKEEFLDLWSYDVHTQFSPPTDCKLDIPTNVEFGEVPMSTNGIQRRLEGSLTCDYKTSVDLSLTGSAISGTADNKQIKVGDAIVSYAFDNGKATTSVSTEKGVKSSFSLDFILKDSGESAGNKQASVVMTASWY